MAKEVAIGKRAKISEAQQYMLLAVLGAAVFLGVAIALVTRFVDQISFNTEVIKTAEKSIADYSNVIKSTGVCKSPSGSTYSDSELEKCDPESIEITEIPGTLRANILENLAANEALNSVPRRRDSGCINPETNKNFTYKELSKKYSDARGAAELQEASNLIKSCSALRVIPDALPAFMNEEALLASLNQLFILSGWEPESISPSGDSGSTSGEEGGDTTGTNLNQILVGLSIEANSGTTTNVLNSIERSIREFNIQNASIEWGGEDSLIFAAQAAAYYMEESAIQEASQTITAGGN